MRIALYQPDIPQNTGAILRLAACFGVAADIIEPCGFVWSDRRLRRAGMDYLDQAIIQRHASWDQFLAANTTRLILLTTKGDVVHPDFQFQKNDTLLLGRESAGAPPEVHAAVDASLRIPMLPDARSLNVALSVAMVLGEALRQTGEYPEP
ncbi:MAG: tRNA (cytidine(34)-2'-O)-methyltransferase [Alphaproteobacteria bacterium]|nr:tRNA (cytidine(34)-2'-O)-methyltransferase [Alphaproteobacteria bacterium]